MVFSFSLNALGNYAKMLNAKKHLLRSMPSVATVVVLQEEVV